MTERAYLAARALADDDRTPPHERASAARRVAEYEAKHGKPKAPAPRRYRADEHPMTAKCARCGKDFAWHYMASAMDRPISCSEFTPRRIDYSHGTICAQCGHNFVHHEISMEFHSKPCLDDCACSGFVPKVKPRQPEPQLYDPCACGHTWARHDPKDRHCGGWAAGPGCGCKKFTRPSVPWWTLEIHKAGSNRRLGITTEFRQVLRSVRKEIADSPRFVVVLGWGCYDVPQETAERIEWGLVD